MFINKMAYSLMCPPRSVQAEMLEEEEDFDAAFLVNTDHRRITKPFEKKMAFKIPSTVT